jgi:hypothetical protein
MNATMTNSKSRLDRLNSQLAELATRRNELHAEMCSGLTGRVDSAWFADRANEMDHMNRSIIRLQVLVGSLEV